MWECDATRGEVISPVACAVAVDSHRHPVALPPGSACVLEPGNSRSGRRCALYSHLIISLLSFFLLDFEGPPTAAIRVEEETPTATDVIPREDPRQSPELAIHPRL